MENMLGNTRKQSIPGGLGSTSALAGLLTGQLRPSKKWGVFLDPPDSGFANSINKWLNNPGVFFKLI